MAIQISSWLRAYFALQESATESRGFVELRTGDDDVERWPRTIGSDVIAIAAVIDPYMHTFGGDGIARRWGACVDGLVHSALGAPRREHVENRAYWRTLSAVCVFLHSQSAPLPPQHVWDALLDQLEETGDVRNAGPSGDGPFKHFNAQTFSDLYLEQLKYLRDLRGSDNLDPEPGMSGGNKVIPRTTNGDVVLLADYWGKQLARVKEVYGHAAVEKKWKETLVDVDAIARKGDPNAVYPKNNAFWRVLSKTAIQVSAADEAPSTSDIMLESLKDSVTHLPENIKAGTKVIVGELAGLAGDAARSVGKVAQEAGKGLFSGFGTPLLLGAGLLGLFLISRSKHESAEA